VRLAIGAEERGPSEARNGEACAGQGALRRSGRYARHPSGNSEGKRSMERGKSLALSFLASTNSAPER
jgi:hypothetical protein